MSLELHKKAAVQTVKFFLPILVVVPAIVAAGLLAFYAPYLLLVCIPFGLVVSIYVIEYRHAARIEKIRQESGGLSG